MKRKCIALISGGLDSSLAVKLMLNQGIEVHGLYFSMSWGCCNKEKAICSAGQLGIPIMVLSVGDAYLDLIRRPKHGYGKALNPCRDCRIYMFRIARSYMEELGAGFVVTGEILGQRPMSQMRDSLNLIERECGLKGLLLRPLSASMLEPTLPESLGIVDRSLLLGLSGRSRHGQFALAKKEGITEYSNPAGGCLLTDEHFAKKAKDLLRFVEHPTEKDMQLLVIGRHFRAGPNTKIILGRNELENLLLEGHADRKYTCVRPKFPGPSALVAGEWTNEAAEITVRLILQYTKAEKVPDDGDLQFSRNGNTWNVRHMVSDRIYEESAVKL